MLPLIVAFASFNAVDSASVAYGTPRRPIPRTHLFLRGGEVPLTGAAGTRQEEEEERLREEYERYVAAVETPLSNFEEAEAQSTQAIRIRGLLSKADIEAIHRAGSEVAHERPDSIIDRSAWGQPEGTWRVTFLNAGGAFEALLPDLYARVRDAALAVDRDHWNVTTGIEHVNYRVVEYHTMLATLDGKATGGGAAHKKTL